MDIIQIILSISLGVGLAAAVGFRVFLPLLILSIATHFNYIPLQENWQWIGSLTALIALSIASILELFGYFIPWVDNILDTIALPLATVAGTIAMAATLTQMDPLLTWALAIIAGGGTAATIKGNTSALRLTSTATTGGVANPIITATETLTSSTLSILALVFAPLALLLVFFFFYLIYKFYKRRKKRSI